MSYSYISHQNILHLEKLDQIIGGFCKALAFSENCKILCGTGFRSRPEIAQKSAGKHLEQPLRHARVYAYPPGTRACTSAQRSHPTSRRRCLGPAIECGRWCARRRGAGGDHASRLARDFPAQWDGQRPYGGDSETPWGIPRPGRTHPESRACPKRPPLERAYTSSVRRRAGGKCGRRAVPGLPVYARFGAGLRGFTVAHPSRPAMRGRGPGQGPAQKDERRAQKRSASSLFGPKERADFVANSLGA